MQNYLECQVDLGEAIALGAKDGLFFSYFFLPESFSLEPGEYHRQFFDILDDTSNQFISVAVFRDGGKTTLVRSTALRRICYGISRTILITSESKPHASRTLRWLRNKIKKPGSLLASSFELSIGNKDNDEELKIINGRFGQTITVIAQGVTGQVRGINEDDSRPDLIIVDDAGSDENMATEIQRNKISQIYFGAIENSLAARAINPHSQIINITTRHADDDLHGMCMLDPRYKTFSLGVFNKEGKSTWPSKFSTEQLYRDKQAAIARRQLSTWLREKENQIIRAETTLLDPQWLHLEGEIQPDFGQWVYMLGFDPSNPPSDLALAKGLPNKDYAVWTVLGFRSGHVKVVKQEETQTPDPMWERQTFLALNDKYKPLSLGVESVAYQRTSARLIQELLKEHRIYIRIEEIVDQRKKVTRINDELAPLAYNGCLIVNPACTRFIHAYSTFPGCEHFDFLDSVVIGLLACRAYAGGLHYPKNPAAKLVAQKEQSFEAMIAAEAKQYGALESIAFSGGPP